MSKSTVSKSVRGLEDRLGARLLHRTTRSMQLTDIGSAFFERCAPIVSAAEEAERSVSQMLWVPHGRLRISAPISLGQRYLADIVSDYITLYPEVTVDLELNDRRVNLIDEGYDLAIRVGRRAEPGLISRKLVAARRVVVASPGYFEVHGAPRTPADVGAHECLLDSHDEPPDTWRFDGPDGEIAVRVDGRLRTNSGDVLASAACDGLGMAMLPDFVVAEDVRANRLRPVLTDICQSLGAVYVVYPHSRHLSAKVRVFVDELLATFSSQ